MLPNQRFGEVCLHNMHLFFYTRCLYFMCHCSEYKLSALQVEYPKKIYSTLRHSST